MEGPCGFPKLEWVQKSLKTFLELVVSALLKSEGATSLNIQAK